MAEFPSSSGPTRERHIPASRFLESALRVDSRHDVLDRAVLAGGIHCLENDERPAVLRLSVWRSASFTTPAASICVRLLLGDVEFPRVGLVAARNAESFPGGYPIRFGDPRQGLRHVEIRPVTAWPARRPRFAVTGASRAS